MVIINYNTGDFSKMSPSEIAIRFSYGQVRNILEIAKGVPRTERSSQLREEIDNLERALVICTGEFIPGARNIH